MREFQRQVKLAVERGDPPITEPQYKWAMKTCNNGPIKATLKATENYNPITAEEMNAGPLLVACEDGTYDLGADVFREPRREDYITLAGKVKHDMNAECPEFIKFMYTIFLGDEKLIRYVQRALGYSMTGLITEQCFFMCVGNGANGKSTLFDIMTYILNEYSDHISMDVILDKSNRGHLPTPELAKIKGKRLVFISESKDEAKLNEALIKKHTGGEKVTARFLYANTETFEVTYKLWIASNSKIDINGMDHGIWRRVRLIPFNHTFAEEDKDKKFLDKLKVEASGIFNWLVEGYRDYVRLGGLCEPEAVLSAVSSYKEEMDPLKEFLELCVAKSDDGQIRAAVLYHVYCKFAKENGNKPMSQKAFGRHLFVKEYKKERNNQGFAYKEIVLTDFGRAFM